MTKDDTRVLNRVGTAEDGTEYQEMGAIPKVHPSSHTCGNGISNISTIRSN